MVQSIVNGIIILLVFWLLSPLIWIALVLIPMILRHPGEFLLNRDAVNRRVAHILTEDKVFEKVYPVMGFPLNLLLDALDKLNIRKRKHWDDES